MSNKSYTPSDNFKKTYEALEKLGLTEYEAKIYTILVKMGQKNATEISFLSRVPRPKTYGAIKNLKKKGLITIISGKPERYSAVSPNNLLLPIVKTMIQDAEECKKIVESLALSFEASRYISPERQFETYEHWIIKGRDKVHKKIIEMIDKAQDYIFIITSANGIIRAYKAFSNILEKARRMKVDVRVMAPLTAENKTAIQEFSEIIKIKVENTILPRYIIIDGKEIMFIDATPNNLIIEDGQDIGTWTDDPFLAQMYRKLFLNIWEKNS